MPSKSKVSQPGIQVGLFFNQVAFMVESHWNPGVWYIQDKHGFSMSAGNGWTNAKRCRQQVSRINRRYKP